MQFRIVMGLLNNKFLTFQSLIWILAWKFKLKAKQVFNLLILIGKNILHLALICEMHFLFLSDWLVTASLDWLFWKKVEKLFRSWDSDKMHCSMKNQCDWHWFSFITLLSSILDQILDIFFETWQELSSLDEKTTLSPYRLKIRKVGNTIFFFCFQGQDSKMEFFVPKLFL